MSSSADSHILTMKFENAQFERGVSTTLGTMAKLKQSLNFGNVTNGATKGLGSISSILGRFSSLNPFARSQKGVQDLQSSASHFTMAPVEGAVTGVSKKFLALSTIAITALSGITSKAMTSGAQLVKSLTLAPIMDGFHEYETNMNSIQTVLANTKDQGTNLKDVNNALNELNTYSDKTIYNFSEMAKNIGTFTAAGVDLKTSVASIKGIANLAAISGSNSQQASTAMYQLSQAISAGRVGLQDWNSVVNAGMGGAVFQKALARTAENMGTIGKNSVKASGPMKKLTINGQSFRESITAKPGEKSWLTSDVLTNTLKQFGGDMTDAQLKAQGFTDAQVKAIQSMGKMGQDAATKVKTLTQLMSTLKESVGSGWTKSFQLILGNFGEAKTLFTATSNALGGMIQKSANARNKVLGDWKKLGGRDLLIGSITSAFNALMAILKPIKQAFQDIFPPMTGKKLFELTKNLKAFTDGLMISDKTSQNLKRTFKGVFAVFDIAKQIIGGVVGVIFDLVGTLAQGSGGFLSFTGGIGDFLVALDNAIKKGGLLTGFFNGLSAVLKVPLRLLGAVGQLLGGLFGGFDNGAANGVSKSLDKVQTRLKPLATVGQVLANVWGHISDAFKTVAARLAPLGATVSKAFGNIGDAIANAFSGDNFSKTLDTINTGLIAGIVLLLKRMAGGDLFKVDVGGGLFKNISGAFGQLTDTLKSMQAQIKADVLLKIAIAMGILTASIVTLSLIDSKKLTKALGAVAISFGILQLAMTGLSKAISGFGAAKLPLITGAILLLALALLLLSQSVKQLAKLNLQELAKGLGSVSVLLLAMVTIAKPLSANAGGMIRAGLGMLILAAGLKVMASAVADFAKMSWHDMVRGFSGLAIALVAVAGAMKLMPRGMIAQATALVILGAALKILASVVKDFAGMKWSQMIKGFEGLGIALGIIAVAMNVMPKDMLLQAAALLILSSALKSIGGTIANMGGMSMEQIAKGLGTLAASLVILAAGLYLMSGTLGGAAALLVAAGALAILAPVLVILGSLSWGMIIKSMVALAAAFTVLGIAGLLLAPVTPILLALSAAMLLFGAGLALAGAGALAFAAAFGIVVAAGSVGISVLGAMLKTILKSIPTAIKSFAQGIVEFAKVIGRNVGAFTKAFGSILGAILNAVIRNVPKIGRAFLSIITTAARVIVNAIPTIASAGLRLLLGLLGAIDKNIYRIVIVTGDIIVKFLNGLSKALPRVIDAGFRFIISFINGLTRAINKNSNALSTAGWNLAIAIVNGMIKGLRNGVSVVASWARYVASEALHAALHFLGIHSPSREFMKVGMYSAQGMALGLKNYAHVAATEATGLAEGVLGTVKDTMSGLSDAVSANMDVNPVITPVLDLTQIQKDATKMGSIVSTTPVSAGVSFSQASSISADRQASQDASVANSSASATTPASVVFEQNNYSPKALSAVEIYRNTRNQLSLAKEALKA